MFLLVEAPAHPRSRGEHCAGEGFVPDGVGSSPLARGTLLNTCSLLTPPRLIPARAGNTFLIFFAMIEAPAHPRSRGEHCG